MNITGILDAIVSHAMVTGLFESVNSHEPKNAPGNGITCAVWSETVGPAQSSGLASTSGVLVFTIRIYQNFLSEPLDMIDPTVLNAVDVLMTEYSGDFDLGGTVRNVDLLGMAGTALSARAGYLSMDGKMFRIVDITLPIIVNDVWDQNG